MADHRQPPARPSPAEAPVQPEKACEEHDRPAPNEAQPPRAGRTGGLGARAERPEDTRRKPTEKEPPRRGAKSPSAADAHSDDRSSK